MSEITIKLTDEQAAILESIKGRRLMFPFCARRRNATPQQFANQTLQDYLQAIVVGMAENAVSKKELRAKQAAMLIEKNKKQ